MELGDSYLALRKYALAEQAFLKAKSIDDDSCAACGLGKPAALEQYETLRKINPEKAAKLIDEFIRWKTESKHN